ncbi:Double-stranded RNA-binding [Cynara cardunculus var. scolymus]|uniref:Double-stranded RNA-binding n=1 Tax=Cynara cardunculus var. scolymus TaxID=59895 RepID=A0A103XEP5_CYNCS|nr:Double-stranded RNA-binding [Cynara cardunculus var. scolymus]
MAHLYKSRLQNYAQKKNIAFPTYACEMQGPYSRLFKARVTIDGVMYEGPEFCTTLKDAEHAGAKVPFTSTIVCNKSLLQGLVQKKGLVLPVYATNRVGPPHMPRFASTVQIAGKCFVRQEARTKKQAEMNATCCKSCLYKSYRR